MFFLKVSVKKMYYCGQPRETDIASMVSNSVSHGLNMMKTSFRFPHCLDYHGKNVLFKVSKNLAYGCTRELIFEPR